MNKYYLAALTLNITMIAVMFYATIVYPSIDNAFGCLLLTGILFYNIKEIEK